MLTLQLPTPRNASDAAFQVRVLDRAERFDLDGYHYEELCHKLYRVFKPGNTNYSGPADYLVDLLGMTCSCGCFKENGYCKHYLAIERDYVRCEEYEQQRAAAELETTGCDPYAEF